MIFKEYKINKIDKDKEEERQVILESISRKFNSDYNKFLKEKKREKGKIIKLREFNEEKEKLNKEERRKIIRTYYIPSFKNKLLYYNGSFYAYTPSGVKVERVSQGILGNNVLGRAFPGANIIQILDTLYGLDFEEVKKHEINHMIYPFLTEEQIRMKTKQELPFYTRYH